MSEFKEFPKKMSHPDYRPAVFEQLPCNCKDPNRCNCRTGLFARDTVMKSPERYGEVTVHTPDQQKFYEARGYRSNSTADVAAYEQALLEMKPVAGYTNNAYPKWKYHAMEIPVIVKSEQEEDALGDGWGDAPIIATEDDLPVMESAADDEEEEPAIVAPAKPKAKKATKAKPKSTARAKQSRAPKSAHA